MKLNHLAFLFAIIIFQGCCNMLCGLPDFPEFSDPVAVTSGPKDHLFASYYGINSWSKDHRYVSVLETDIKGRLVEAGEAATIALVDLQDNNRLIPIAQTYCWNFQEGTMAHWLPWADNTLIYNDIRDGKFVAVILNWKTGEERIIPHPISAVSEDGRWAVSINYARLRHARPDYGYAGNGQDAQLDVQWPENDGLWLVDLMTGEAKLIVSIASQKDNMTEVHGEGGLAYFCHTVFSKDGKKIFWLARTMQPKNDYVIWETTSMTCDVDGSNVRRCYPDGWHGSHFNWLDGETLAVTAKWNAGKEWGHTIFKVGEEDKVRHIAPGILDWDGHCLFLPGGEFMSSEGYINRDGFRSWVLIRLEDELIKPLGAYYVPEVYRHVGSRCDLHARVRPDGKQIGFNSVHEGTRQVYIRDIEW